MNYADSIRYILTGTYRGMHDSKKPMHIGVLCLCVISVSLSFILGKLIHDGAVGVRLGLAVGIVCAAVYMIYDFFYGKLSNKLRSA